MPRLTSLLALTATVVGLASVTGSTGATAASHHPALLQHSAPERWAPPLGRPVEVSAPYRAPTHRYGAGHRGIDLPATPGETVLAPVPGVISFAGTVVDRGVISIRVDARTVVSLEPVLPEVATGETVLRGQRLGRTGEGGHCLAECLHLGLRIDDEYADPMRHLVNRPILLPWE